jgi:hypothetical protein
VSHFDILKFTGLASTPSFENSKLIFPLI